jgi:mannose-6-phosphate isomerase-like protein (cupin superfamily)
VSVFRRLSPDDRPPWSDVTSAGFTRVVAGNTFDPHYHDCDEYWFIIGGRAIARIEDERFELGPGDILCTQIGRLHDVLAVDDVLEMVWFEARLAPGGRDGHLHRSELDAAGHPVERLEA